MMHISDHVALVFYQYEVTLIRKNTFRNYSLKLGLSENVGYPSPVNVAANLMGQPYLYCGFVPASLINKTVIQGLRV